MRPSIFYLLMVILLAGCGLSDKEKVTVSELTQDMQTFCVGRHLIDVPKGFSSIIGGAANFMLAGVSIEVADPFWVSIKAVDISAQQFRSAVDKQRAEVAANRNMLSKDSMLKEFKSVGENAFLLRAYESSLSRDSFRSELHLLIEGVHVVVAEKSFENEFLQAEKRIEAFSKNLVRVQPSSTAKGFCIGPIAVQGDSYSLEQTDFTFRSKKRPDVIIEIDIDTYSNSSQESDTLLQRVSGERSLLSIFDVRHKVLRKGNLTIAGMKAQEWLATFENGDHKDHQFAFESYRPKPSSPAHPAIHMEMTTGQQDLDGVRHTSSLSDKEAMAVWDTMVKSIRLRPGAV